MRRALIYLLTALCLLATPVLAREAVLGMSERVLKAITRVQEQIDAKNYDAALEELQSMNRKRLSSYETAHVFNIEGFIYYQKNDIPRAFEAYQQALAQERLPDSMIANLRLTLGRLELLQEQYDNAIGHFSALLKIEKQDKPLHRVLLANAYFGKRDFDSALVQMRRAIDETRAAGDQPRENWLSLTAAIYYELEDFDSMLEVTRELASIYPREQHFMNLAALYGQQGDQKRQLALVESLLQDNRISSQQHLEMLANLYLAQDLPYKAAKLLEKELAAERIEADQQLLELLSQAWYGAAEARRAIPPLERAAGMAEDGEVYVRVARLYMDIYDWEGAEKAAAAALEKGGLKEEGSAWLLQGMALARMNEWGRAAEVFARAAGHEETATYAVQWIAYVEGEKAREASLESGS